MYLERRKFFFNQIDVVMLLPQKVQLAVRSKNKISEEGIMDR